MSSLVGAVLGIAAIILMGRDKAQPRPFEPYRRRHACNILESRLCRSFTNLGKAVFTLGVTGRIGSGKYLVTSLFEQKGIFVVDADQEARAIVELNQPALRAIYNRFGKTVITADGHLDRASARKKFLPPLPKNNGLRRSYIRLSANG